MAESTPLTQDQIGQFNTAMNMFYENDDESQLRELFKLFDRDGNGKISATEIRTVMSSVSGDHVSENEVQDMLNEADTNKDGCIDLNEFVMVMRKHK